LHTPQADHTEEVIDVVLPANYESSKMMEPSEKSLNSPTSAVATKRAAVLGRFSARSAMRSDHLDAVSLGQIPIRMVTVIGSVTDYPRRKGIEEAVSEEAFDELAFVWGSAFDTDGERKTVTIGENEDFRPLAAFGRRDCGDPLFCARESGGDECLL
jgi:hypothetical protein